MCYYNYLDFNPYIYIHVAQSGSVFFVVFLLLAGHCFGCFSKDPEADKKEKQVSISRIFVSLVMYY